MVHIGNDWDEVLAGEFDKGYYTKLRAALAQEYRTRTVFPPMGDIFNALKLTAYNDTNVVILGQDPYHGEGQAHGLCFSVPDGVKPPPSLVNIYKEIEAETGVKMPQSGCLTGWARQGVLLLNTTLTVRAHEPASHKKLGWEHLTDRIIWTLSERERPLVFMLWGAHARAKREFILNDRHLVLEAAHPSPLSAHSGFFGCGHFIKANEFLKAHGASPIEWEKI